MLIQQESTRNMFQRINRVVGNNRMQGVNMVLEQNQNGEWEERNTPYTIFPALQTAYHAKYHQTEKTPPMQYPLLQILGYLGTNDCSDAILEGKFVPVTGMRPYSTRLMEKLRKIPNYEDIPVGISTRDYQTGWKKAKETKSSGGALIHFGHCKSMAQDNKLSSMEAAFLSIPLRSGYPYHNWTKGINCTLVKKGKSYRVDKLRTIVLFEANFNFINKAVS